MHIFLQRYALILNINIPILGGDYLKKNLRGLGFYLILFAVILILFVMTSMPETTSTVIYSDLVSKIKAGEPIRRLHFAACPLLISSINDNSKQANFSLVIV